MIFSLHSLGNLFKAEQKSFFGVVHHFFENASFIQETDRFSGLLCLNDFKASRQTQPSSQLFPIQPTSPTKEGNQLLGGAP